MASPESLFTRKVTYIVLSLCMFALAAGSFWLVHECLSTGTISHFSKRATSVILRSDTPNAFWITVAIWSTAAGVAQVAMRRVPQVPSTRSGRCVAGS